MEATNKPPRFAHQVERALSEGSRRLRELQALCVGEKVLPIDQRIEDLRQEIGWLEDEISELQQKIDDLEAMKRNGDAPEAPEEVEEEIELLCDEQRRFKQYLKDAGYPPQALR